MGRQISKLLNVKARSVNGSKNSSSPPSTQESLPQGFRWMSGRGFKSEGNPAYMLPNDMPEEKRLNAQHYLMRYCFQTNFHVPLEEALKKGIKVLDVGCGTGIWSIEMAQTYPNSTFYGTDLINVFQSSAAQTPDNCVFQVVDTLQGLPVEDGTFDFVFQRFQTLCFRENEWPRVIAELTRVTKPGGWIEMVETDNDLQQVGPYFSILWEKFNEALTLRSIAPKFARDMPEYLESVGIQDIKQDHCSIPIGWGPPEIAAATRTNYEAVFNSLKPQLTIAIGLGEDEYDDIVKGARTELGVVKGYCNVYYAYGRKPLDTISQN